MPLLSAATNGDWTTAAAMASASGGTGLLDPRFGAAGVVRGGDVIVFEVDVVDRDVHLGDLEPGHALHPLDHVVARRLGQIGDGHPELDDEIDVDGGLPLADFDLDTLGRVRCAASDRKLFLEHAERSRCPGAHVVDAGDLPGGNAGDLGHDRVGNDRFAPVGDEVAAAVVAPQIDGRRGIRHEGTVPETNSAETDGPRGRVDRRRPSLCQHQQMRSGGSRQVLDAVEAMLAALRPQVDRDWQVPAGPLEWSCQETAAHVANDLAKYAAQLAGRATDRYLPFDLVPFPAATTTDILDIVAACGRLLAAVVERAGPAARAWHWGMADAAGFAAMGVGEVLVHTHDITSGLGVDWWPPGDL